MKQRNSGYIAIGANINKLQHVQSADNFVKKWDSIFTTCNPLLEGTWLSNQKQFWNSFCLFVEKDWL